MAQPPIVSVLMTAYNREKYIAEAIESVLASEFTDFELIIVDDCSKDNTVAIAKTYAAKDKRIQLYTNEKNLGDYPNRNKAASYATGKYLKYLDSDDIIYPEGLAVFVKSMEAFPEAAVGIAIDGNRGDTASAIMMSPAEAYQYHFYQKGLFDMGPSGLIFHAARFREIGGFSGKRYVGDTEINLKVAARWPVVKITASLVFWRQHDGQEIVAGLKSTGYLELHLPMHEEAFDAPGCPLSGKEKRAILGYHRKVSAREIIKLLFMKRKPALAWYFYKKLSLRPVDLYNAIFFMKRKF